MKKDPAYLAALELLAHKQWSENNSGNPRIYLNRLKAIKVEALRTGNDAWTLGLVGGQGGGVDYTASDLRKAFENIAKETETKIVLPEEGKAPIIHASGQDAEKLRVYAEKNLEELKEEKGLSLTISLCG